jgi:hypothetical protein
VHIQGSRGTLAAGGAGLGRGAGKAPPGAFPGRGLTRAGVLVLGAGLILLASIAPASAQERPAEPERAKAPQDKAPADKPEGPLYGLYVETVPEFDTGTYGTKSRSDFLYVPLTVGYDRDDVLRTGDRASARVTVPWEYQRTQGNVIRIGGKTIRTSKTAAHATKTEAGLGDILVDGGYTFFKEDKDRSLPSLTLDAEVKIPTADDERELGTGAYDESLRLTSDFTFFKKWKLSLSGGYGFIGQPEDFTKPKFHDTIYWEGGVGYAFNRDNELWLHTDGDTAIVKHQPPYSLVYFEFDHWFKNESKLFFSFGFGLTTASPGLMVSLGYEYYF